MPTRTLSYKSALSDRRLEELQFRLILGVCFLPILVGVAASRLVHAFGSEIQATRRRGSILSEAWNASGIVAKTAFDG